MNEDYIKRIHKLFDLYDKEEIDRQQFISKLIKIYEESEQQKKSAC